MKNLLKCVFLLSLSYLSHVSASPIDYKEGVYYHAIKPALERNTKNNKVEVIEVFFYACPHCHRLDSKITEWLKDKRDLIDFKRMPAIVGPQWIEQAKAFYTAKKLGILDKIHPALFESIHKGGKQYYNSYTLKAFFIEQGVSEIDFLKAYNSEEVSQNLQHARLMTVKYNLRGVPAIIINGQYKTAQYFTGTQEKMLDVVNYLVHKEKMAMNNKN